MQLDSSIVTFVCTRRCEVEAAKKKEEEEKKKKEEEEAAAASQQYRVDGNRSRVNNLGVLSRGTSCVQCFRDGIHQSKLIKKINSQHSKIEYTVIKFYHKIYFFRAHRTNDLTKKLEKVGPNLLTFHIN